MYAYVCVRVGVPRTLAVKNQKHLHVIYVRVFKKGHIKIYVHYRCHTKKITTFSAGLLIVSVKEVYKIFVRVSTACSSPIYSNIIVHDIYINN